MNNKMLVRYSLPMINTKIFVVFEGYKLHDHFTEHQGRWPSVHDRICPPNLTWIANAHFAMLTFHPWFVVHIAQCCVDCNNPSPMLQPTRFAVLGGKVCVCVLFIVEINNMSPNTN